MLDYYDESDLLAYIDDTLDPERVVALRARLEADEAVMELVEAMRRDRALLASEPPPPLPEDFATRLEQQLVRPMLMESFNEQTPTPALSRPGQERRRHRRERHLRLARRFAVAAAIVLVAGGGVWFAINQIELPGTTSQIAAAPTQDSRSFDDADARHVFEPAEWDTEDASIHHLMPPAVLSTDMLTEATETSLREGHRADHVTAKVVLHVQSSDLEQGEQTLKRVLEHLSTPAAFVQNFSYDEARRLERAWLMERRSTSQVPEPSKMAGREEMRQFIHRVREQYHANSPQAPAEDSISRQLFGEREFAAPFGKQLEFSSHGATHTVTIPVGQLRDLLAALALADQQQTTLRQLAEYDTQLSSGFADRAAVKRLLDELYEAGDEAMVHLPVLITAGDRP